MKSGKEKQERIQHCVELMSCGAWVNGVTSRKLAEKWGLRYETVSRYAAEASRIISSTVIGSDELKARLSSMLDSCIADFELVKRTSGPGSKTTVDALRGKVEAIKAVASLHGVDAPKKHDVTVGNDLTSLYDIASGVKTPKS